MAISNYYKAIEINPNYVQAYFNRGFAYFQLKDYFGALRDYGKVLQINDNYYEAYNNRGLVYHRQA